MAYKTKKNPAYYLMQGNYISEPTSYSPLTTRHLITVRLWCKV